MVALTDEVGKLGYAFVQIEPQPDKHAAERTIDITYVINEGPRVYVERIDITGNLRTLDKVIRREFRVDEGDAFNTALLRRSRQRIQDLGFFEKVDMNTTPGSSPDKTVIKVDVAERSTGELSFGAGFSTSEGPLGDVRLSERNLLGTGQSILADFTISARTQQINFSFTEPYFLDRDLAAGVDLFDTKTNFQSEGSFDQKSLGGTLRASYPLTEHWRHGVKYTLRQDEISNVDSDASQYIQDEEGTSITSLVGQSLTYDVRDTKFLPSDGYLVRLDQDIAGLGGDTPLHPPRAERLLLLPVHAGLGAQPGGPGRLHLRHRRRGGAPVRPLLPGRADAARLQVRGRRTARHLDRRCARRQSPVHRDGGAALSPWVCPRSSGCLAGCSSRGASLTDVDAHGPDVEDSAALRASAGVGLSWLSPLGPIAVDLSQAFLKESAGRDRDLPDQLRHPLLRRQRPAVCRGSTSLSEPGDRRLAGGRPGRRPGRSAAPWPRSCRPRSPR